MAELLKPCPWCGGEKLTIREPSAVYVRCLLCLIDGPARASKHEAIAAWNRRATNGQRAGVPEGYVLMPVELTPEMIKAGANSGGLGMNFLEWMGRLSIAWRHMLAAAPTPPAGDAGPFAGVSKVERESDFSVRLTFDSCRQASAFDRAAMAAMADSKGDAA